MRLDRRSFIGLALAAPGLVCMQPHASASVGQPRLVSLDLVITEMLLTLGITPIATANIPLYRRLMADPPLPATVADLGPIGEPNQEYLYRLSPDRILVADWQAPGLETLARIAPLEPVSLFTRDVPALDHTESVLTRLGSLFGAEVVARLAIASTRAQIATGRAALAGFHRPVLLCRFNRDGRNVAVFGGNAMLGDVLQRLGLKNAYSGRVNAASGGANVPITQLATKTDAVILHFDRGAETEAAMERLAENPIWRALPAVRAGRVIRIPVIYPTGAVRSAGRFAEHLTMRLSELHDG